MSTDDQRSSRSTRSRSISTSSEPRSGDTSDQTDGCVLRPPEPRRNDGREARPSQLTLTGKAKTSKSVAGSRIPLSPSMLDRLQIVISQLPGKEGGKSFLIQDSAFTSRTQIIDFYFLMSNKRGTVVVISCDPPCMEDNARFTLVPLKSFFDQ